MERSTFFNCFVCIIILVCKVSYVFLENVEQNAIHKNHVVSNPLPGNTKSRTLYDYQTRVVAYKDLIESKCLLEVLNGGDSLISLKISDANANNRESLSKSFITSSELSKRQIWRLAGQRITEFCRGFPTYLIKDTVVDDQNVDVSYMLNDLPIIDDFVQQRVKRQSNHYFVGRVRGQTQSQYLNFGQGGEPGKAEAESTYNGTKAVVTGSSGMGQAQSQSSPFGCEECLGAGLQDQTLDYGGDRTGPRIPGAETRYPQSQIYGGERGQSSFPSGPGYTDGKPHAPSGEIGPSTFIPGGGKVPGDSPGLDRQQPGAYIPGSDTRIPGDREQPGGYIPGSDIRIPGDRQQNGGYVPGSDTRIPGGQVPGQGSGADAETRIPGGAPGGYIPGLDTRFPGGQLPGQGPGFNGNVAQIPGGAPGPFAGGDGRFPQGPAVQGQGGPPGVGTVPGGGQIPEYGQFPQGTGGGPPHRFPEQVPGRYTPGVEGRLPQGPGGLGQGSWGSPDTQGKIPGYGQIPGGYTPPTAGNFPGENPGYERFPQGPEGSGRVHEGHIPGSNFMGPEAGGGQVPGSYIQRGDDSFRQPQIHVPGQPFPGVSHGPGGVISGGYLPGQPQRLPGQTQFPGYEQGSYSGLPKTGAGTPGQTTSDRGGYSAPGAGTFGGELSGNYQSNVGNSGRFHGVFHGQYEETGGQGQYRRPEYGGGVSAPGQYGSHGTFPGVGVAGQYQPGGGSSHISQGPGQGYDGGKPNSAGIPGYGPGFVGGQYPSSSYPGILSPGGTQYVGGQPGLSGVSGLPSPQSFGQTSGVSGGPTQTGGGGIGIQGFPGQGPYVQIPGGVGGSAYPGSTVTGGTASGPTQTGGGGIEVQGFPGQGPYVQIPEGVGGPAYPGPTVTGGTASGPGQGIGQTGGRGQRPYETIPGQTSGVAGGGTAPGANPGSGFGGIKGSSGGIASGPSQVYGGLAGGPSTGGGTDQGYGGGRGVPGYGGSGQGYGGQDHGGVGGLSEMHGGVGGVPGYGGSNDGYGGGRRIPEYGVTDQGYGGQDRGGPGQIYGGTTGTPGQGYDSYRGPGGQGYGGNGASGGGYNQKPNQVYGGGRGPEAARTDVAGGGAPGQAGNYGTDTGGGTGPGGRYSGSGTDAGQVSPQQYVEGGQGLGVGVSGVGRVDGSSDDSDSQVQTSVKQSNNETLASAQAQGRFAGGTAQSQVSGTYSGTGSFSASAGSDDGKRGALTQVTGGKDGASSSAQGRGGLGQSQAQVVLSPDTGDTLSTAQTSGLNHGTQTQVQASEKGGMADAQANGPGSTSSQAQIGFAPYDENETDEQETPFKGGGTAAAQSGTNSGMTQTQIQGKFRYGIKYTGAAQAGSGTSLLRNLTEAHGPFTPINFTLNASRNIGKVSQSQKIAVAKQRLNKTNRTSEATGSTGAAVPDPMTAASTYHTDTKVVSPVGANNNGKHEGDPTTLIPDYADEDYEPEYDEEEDVETERPAKRNLITQTSNNQRQHIILDPLEDLDATVHQSKGDYPPDGSLLQPGQLIPGSGGYQIPAGFRGKVRSIANGRNTYAIGKNAQAQSVTLSPGSGRVLYKSPVYAVSSKTLYRNGHVGYGTGYTYQPAYQPVRYGLKNGKVLPNFVSVSKSETGSKNLETGQKSPSVRYTQSSSCGLFTNSCVFSGGKKLCYPKPKTNPDGSLMVC